LKPKAIVVFTAHWESETLQICSRDDPYETIYDFGGFAEALYKMKYNAKGSTKIAAMLKEKFKNQGIASQLNTKRGLDHGSWVLLKRMYPNADIPVIQCSVNPDLAGPGQIKIGQALQGLGKEGIMVIGSGTTVHNFEKVNFSQKGGYKWAIEFDDWLVEKTEKKDLESLGNFAKLAPNAQLAVPTTEHFVPYLIAVGSGDPSKQPKALWKGYFFGSFSNLSIEL